MYFEENVKILKKYSIELKECDKKSVGGLYFTNPITIENNLKILEDNSFKLNHVNNHSLLITIIQNTKELQDKVDYLVNNGYQPFLRNLCFIAQLGYVKNEKIEIDYNEVRSL